MGQKCLTVRARRGTLKSKAQERVRLQCACFDRKSTGAKRVGMEGCRPSFLLSKVPKALCSIPSFVSPVPLTFWPYQTSCHSSKTLFKGTVSLPFAHSVPFAYIAFPFLVCWENSCSSFRTLFCEGFSDVPWPLVEIVDHFLLCMVSALCNKRIICSCHYLLTHLYFLVDCEHFEAYVPPVSVFLVLSTGLGTHWVSSRTTWTHTGLMSSAVHMPIPLPDFPDK